jgi:hypothetical protein
MMAEHARGPSAQKSTTPMLHVKQSLVGVLLGNYSDLIERVNVDFFESCYFCCALGIDVGIDFGVDLPSLFLAAIDARELTHQAIQETCER